LMIEVDWRVTFIDYIQEHKLPPRHQSKKRWGYTHPKAQ
jgi:hypothetical protein